MFTHRRSLGLHGTIPAAVCGLTRLTHLTMDRNHLHGEIPACILCGLPSLEHLDLSDQLQAGALSGSLPGCMGPNLTNLTTLALENNTLTGPVPDGFCSLGKLVSVDVGCVNALPAAALDPELLCDLDDPSLYIHTERTRLESCCKGSVEAVVSHEHAPSCTLFPRFYKSPTCRYNRLTSLPDCLGSLTNLEELRATDNGLTQSFPDSICSLTRLTHLMLNSNALTGSVNCSN